MRVFHKTDVSHIASAEVNDVGSGSDETGETSHCVLARNVVLLHGKQQEIGKVFLGVELEIVEETQFAILFDKQIKISVADVDEDAIFFCILHHAVDEQTAGMGDSGVRPFH